MSNISRDIAISVTTEGLDAAIAKAKELCNMQKPIIILKAKWALKDSTLKALSEEVAKQMESGILIIDNEINALVISADGNTIAEL